jgi:hypothetical protein
MYCTVVLYCKVWPNVCLLSRLTYVQFLVNFSRAQYWTVLWRRFMLTPVRYSTVQYSRSEPFQTHAVYALQCHPLSCIAVLCSTVRNSICALLYCKAVEFFCTVPNNDDAVIITVLIVNRFLLDFVPKLEFVLFVHTSRLRLQCTVLYSPSSEDLIRFTNSPFLCQQVSLYCIDTAQCIPSYT